MPTSSPHTIAIVSTLGATLALTGCNSTRKSDPSPPGPMTELVPAKLDTPDPEPEIVEVPVPVAAPQLRPLPQALRDLGRQQMEPLQAIAEGREHATMDAGDVDGLLAILRYPFVSGVVYTAVTSPGFVTTIELEPGERLVTAAAGDTTRWLVDTIETGNDTDQGASPQTLLLVKPRQPFLQTNLVVTTDRRVYHLDLTSVDVPVYNTAIAWDYPHPRPRKPGNEFIATHMQAGGSGGGAVVGAGAGATVNVAALNFDYAVRLVDGARTPRWMPTRVFDDGRKTYVEFAPDLGTTEAPPLFLLPDGGESDEARLVNYRIDGRFYVVDRLFDAAELRLGTPPGEQTVVRIERRDAETSGHRERTHTSSWRRPVGRR